MTFLYPSPPRGLNNDKNRKESAMSGLDDHTFKALDISRDGAVLTIALSRPEKKNAVNALMHAELAQVFQMAELDEQSRIVVLTGRGDAFSAGGDIDYMKYMRETAGAFAHSAFEARRIIFGLLDLNKPVIARVNGDAVGLGATLALFCDVVVAADHARIGDPHVRVGLVAGDGGAIIWPALVGYARAKSALLTGKLFKAQEAVDIGLIAEAVPANKLDETVARWVLDLDAGATMAVRYTKIALNTQLRQLATSILDASLAYEAVTSHSADHAEAVEAFAERRRPRFHKD